MENKRPILIQGAMQVELNFLLEQLEDKIEINLYGYTFWKGSFYGQPVLISKTDIGSVNATIATTIALLEFKPIAILNQGIAGGCQRNIHKYDIIIGTSCKNTNSYKTKRREIGEGSNPLEWEMLTFSSDDEPEKEKILESDRYLLSIAEEVSFCYSKGNIHKGILGSGDCWNKELDRIEYLVNQTGIVCADMETIGAYSVADKFNTPVLGIRVISDNEILQETYDRETSIEAQRISIEIVKKYIAKK